MSRKACLEMKYFKNFCYNNQGTRKIKDFQKLSNKELNLTFQTNNTKFTIISVLVFDTKSVLIHWITVFW